MGASVSVIYSEPAGETDHGKAVDELAQVLISRSPKMEAVIKKIIMDEKGKAHLINFLKEDFYADSNLKFLRNAEELKNLPQDAAFNKKVDDFTGELFHPQRKGDFDVPDDLRERLCRMVLPTSRASFLRASNEQILGVVNEIYESLLTALSQELIPRFINSKYYREWDPSESEITPEMLQASGITDDSGAFAYFQNAVKKEIDIINESWIAEMLSATSELPKVSMSLATASPKLRGFPLIYVNKTFEETTGYTQGEIVGNNCRFLQSGINDTDISEPESVAMLTDALKNDKPVQVSITNFRRDGTQFRNFLSMKPIYDRPDGRVSFVIGVQYDMSAHSDQLTPTLVDMINEIMEAIPNAIGDSLPEEQ